MTHLSQQQFRQDVVAAEKAAQEGPVFITEAGKPRCVLVNISEYTRLAGFAPAVIAPKPGVSLADLLAVPENEYFDWEPPRLKIRPSDVPV